MRFLGWFSASSSAWRDLARRPRAYWSMRNFLMRASFILLMILTTGFPATGTHADWFTYTSQKPPYSIQYPPNFILRKSDDDLISVGGPLITLENGALTIALYIHPVLGDPIPPSFEDWARTQSMTLCESSGPTGRSYCDGINKMSDFTTSAGNRGYEIYLNIVEETYGGPTERSAVGPMFIFDVSKIAHAHREGLILETDSGRLSPQDLDTFRSLVATLAF